MKSLVQIIRLPFYITMILAFLGKFIFEINLIIAIIAIFMISINISMYKEVKISYISKTGITFICVAVLFWLTYILIGNENNKLIILIDRMEYFKYGVISILNIIVFILYSLYDENLKKQITLIVLVVMFFLISMVIIEVITEVIQNAGRLPRIRGFDDNPNLTGFKLNILLFTIFSLIKHDTKYRVYFIIIDVLVAVCIIFTMSRGSMLIYSIIQIFIFNDIAKKNKKELIIILILFILGSFIVGKFIGNFELRSDRLTIGGWENQDYSNGRLDLVKNGIKAFMENPLWGVGLGNSGVYGVMYGTSEKALMPHNTLVYILAETGIIPATILLTSLIALFFRTSSKEYNSVAKLIIILAIANFFNHNLHLFPIVYISLFTLLIFDEKNTINKLNYYK